MQRRPTLSYRIFLTAVIFLLLPILALSTFLYRNDLNSHRQSIALVMKTFFFESSDHIRKLIQDDLRYLYQLGLKIPKSIEPHSMLESQKKKIGSSDLLLLSKEKGDWKCKWSSSKNLIEKKIKDAEFIKKTEQDGFSRSNFSGNLIISWLFANPDESEKSYILSLITPWRNLLKKIEPQSSYILSIVDNSNRIVATTDPLFQNKIVSSKVEMDLEKQKYALFFKPIEEIPFSILISAKQSLLLGGLIKRFTIEVALVFGITLILGLLLTIFFTKKLSEPLKNLIEVMCRIKEGSLQLRYTKKKFGLEINELGEQFNHMLDQMNCNIEKARKEEERRVQIESELNIARKIQKTLFPSKIPNLPFLTHCTFLPAKEVGGDFYDILPINERCILIVIGDSAGKGVFASLFSHSLRSLIRGLSGENSLERLIEKASRLYLKDASSLGMFTTAFIALFNPKSGEMQYSSLGHPGALLLRNQHIDELKASNLSFGLGEISNPDTKKIQLHSNDLLFFYSDGLNEQPNMENELFSKKRIIETLKQNYKKTPEAIHTALLKKLDAFQERQITLDDITFITMKLKDYKPSPTK